MPDKDGNLTPEEMFNQMMEEQNKMMTPSTPQNPAMPTGQPGEPPVLNSEEQKVLNEIQSKPVASTGSHPTQVKSALPQCPVCGLLHPPNADGKPCTNAPSNPSGGGTANVIDLDMEINKYLVNLKNIAVSQIQIKGIKDVNKLLQYMTLEMTKLLEGYNE
jgi:hypothetical protein